MDVGMDLELCPVGTVHLLTFRRDNRLHGAVSWPDDGIKKLS